MDGAPAARCLRGQRLVLLARQVGGGRGERNRRAARQPDEAAGSAAATALRLARLRRMPSVELARQQWAEGYRRLEQTRPHSPERYRHLRQQVEILTSALAQRVGRVFTLQELAEQYGAADRWAQEVVAEQGAPVPDTSTAADAAFYLY